MHTADSCDTRKAKKKKIQRGPSEKKKKVTDGAASAVEMEGIEEGKVRRGLVVVHVFV